MAEDITYVYFKIKIMKIKTLLLFLSLLFIVPTTSCKKIDTTEEIPTCIKRKIRKESKNGLAAVSKYDFRGGEIYSFYYFSIDGSEYFVDAACNGVCPTAANPTLCAEIKTEVTNRRTIWTSE